MKKKNKRAMLNWLFIALIALSGIGIVYLLFFQRRSSTTTPTTAGSQAPPVATVTTGSGTTLTVPGQVTGVSATASPGSVVISWPVPSGTAPASYKVMRSLTGTPGSFTQIGTPTTNTYTDSTVTGGVSYFYQIIAVNAQGSGTASASVNVTGAATVPGAATGLTATASPGSTALAWTAPATGTAPTGYKVMRRTGAGAYAQVGTTVIAPTVAYSDTTGVAGTAYDYQIIATNTQGDGAASNTASATAQASAATVPGAATGLIATVSGTAIMLSWSAPATGTAPTGYKVMRRTGAGAYAQVGATVAAPAVTYTDSSAVEGTAYDYQIVATNGQGDGAASNTASATVPVSVPQAPASLAANLLGRMLALTWAAPASGVTPTGYKVMRSTSPASGFAEIHNSNNLFYNDISVAPSTLYYYKVLGYTAQGDGADSNTVSITSAA